MLDPFHTDVLANICVPIIEYNHNHEKDTAKGATRDV